MEQKRNTAKYLAIYIGAMVIYGTVGIFRRNIPVSSGFLAFARGVIGTAFLCIFVKIRGRHVLGQMSLKQFIWLAISGALIGINWALLFESYNYTTVSVATLCYYMAPTLVILAAPFALKEKITLKKGICAGIAVVGMIFVSGVLESGISASGEAVGIIFGLGAAVIYAVVVIINKKIVGVDSYTKTIVQLAFAAVIMIPYLFMTGGWSSAAELFSMQEGRTLAIIMILVVGLVHTGLSYAMYFASMERLKANTVAIFSYVDPVVALILSALILGERMGTLGIVGAVLILGAAIVSG